MVNRGRSRDVWRDRAVVYKVIVPWFVEGRSRAVRMNRAVEYRATEPWSTERRSRRVQRDGAVMYVGKFIMNGGRNRSKGKDEVVEGWRTLH